MRPTNVPAIEIPPFPRPSGTVGSELPPPLLRGFRFLGLLAGGLLGALAAQAVLVGGHVISHGEARHHGTRAATLA
jgi:hypothetical protein